MQYIYIAHDKKGANVKGTIEATNEQAATAALHEKGLFPVSLTSKKEALSFFQRKVPLKEKIIFSEQLEIMIRSGLSIIEALKSLQGETQNKRFASQLSQVVSDVESGMPLSDALAKHPSTFSEIYVNLIRSGERSGQVDLVLKRLSDQLQKEYELNRKVRGALSYPIFVLFVLVGVMYLIMVLIIPQLRLIFDDAGVELPILTQIILKISNILKTYSLFVFAGAILSAFLFSRWHTTAAGRYTTDRLIMKIPVIGILLKKTYMARFTRTFATLTASGLPILDALKVSGGVIGNVLYEKEIDQIGGKIKNGQTISKAIKESSLFPAVIGQLSTVGERSGSLSEVFDSLADFFDRDVDSLTSNLSTMLEPMLILIMGGLIGTIVIAVLQPIYSLVNAVQ